MGAARFILVGSGGHGEVVANAVRRTGSEVIGFHDDDPAMLWDRCGQFGPTDQLRESLTEHPDAAWILCIGDTRIRRQILDRETWATPRCRSIIDPDAILMPHSEIGTGTFVSASAVIQVRAVVNKHAIINTGAIVEHDCVIGENAHVGPGAVLGGGVTVGRDTLIGLGARVKPGVTIGSGVTVGVGAVVIEDVPDGQTVVGVPARALGTPAAR